ncbi:MAG: hypothetical protein KAU14_02010 [Thermoplasmata archaeon]|nr:hypothetical protein [Thermoplasmata archaeon]
MIDFKSDREEQGEQWPIVLVTSTDNGNTFGSPAQLNNWQRDFSCKYPQVRITENGTLFIVWDAASCSRGNYYPRGIFFTWSSDGDQGFHDEIELDNYRIFTRVSTGINTDYICSQGHVEVALLNGTAHFIYVEKRFDKFVFDIEEWNLTNSEMSLPGISYQNYPV